MLQAVCSVQTPKNVKHGGNGRDSGTVVTEEGSEERWEMCRSRGEGRRGDKQRGNDLAKRLDMLQKRWRSTDMPKKKEEEKSTHFNICLTTFNSDYGIHSLWHPFDKLMQCHNIYFCLELH